MAYTCTKKEGLFRIAGKFDQLQNISLVVEYLHEDNVLQIEPVDRLACRVFCHKNCHDVLLIHLNNFSRDLFPILFDDKLPIQVFLKIPHGFFIVFKGNGGVFVELLERQGDVIAKDADA